MRLIAWARAAAAAAAVVFIAALALPVRAADDLRGVVLSVLPAQDEAVVRHDAFGGMPAMTMIFRVEPASELAQLHAGDHITARVDMSADPARIDHVAVVGRTAPDRTSAIHDVQPLAVGEGLPDTTFFDQSGRGFSFEDFRGQTLLLAFIYTRCRDPRMCPLISSNFHVLQQKLAGLPIHLVEITLDPAYDTPQILTRYGRQFGEDPARWTFGTGPVNVVNDFAARFGIAVFADPAYGLIHTERTAVINRDGMIVDLIDAAAWNPDDVAAELRSVAEIPSNPIARLDYELSKAAAAICGNNLAGTSGLLDLAIVAAIFGGACWILVFVARKIFVENA